jgi:hypothetical protein
MAGESLVGMGISSTVAFGAGFTGRSNIFGGAYDGSTTVEADFNSPLKAGTLSKMAMFVTSAGGSANGTLTSRVNAAAGSQTVTQTVGGTGWFEDGTHSDSISNNDLITNQCVGVGANTVVSVVTMQYVGTVAIGTSFGTGQNTFSDSAITGSTFLRGQGGTSITTNLIATEANAQCLIRSPGTMSNMRASSSTNAGGNPTTTLVTRVNGSSGAGTVAFTGGTTGAQTDATHTDSVVSGDLYNYQASSGGVSRTITFRQCSTCFVSSGATFDTNCGAQAVGSNNSTVANAFNTIFGRMASATQATEVNAQVRFRFATAVTNFRVFIASISAATSAVCVVRLNGADATGGFTTTAATTGWFEDATHADTIASGDLLCYAAKSSNSNYVLADAGFTFGNVVVTVNATAVTATGTPGTLTPEIDVAITGVTASGSANDPGYGVGYGAPSATATGAANDAPVDMEIPVVGATATGAAADVGFASGDVVQPDGVHATGAAGDVTLGIDSNVTAGTVTATGLAHAITPEISIDAGKAFAFAQAGVVRGHPDPRVDLPVLSIMRNTAVPAIGAMSNEAIAVIGRMNPSGPEPVSVAAIIVGASATGVARNVTPFRNVLMRVQAATAQCVAADVAVTVT